MKTAARKIALALAALALAGCSLDSFQGAPAANCSVWERAQGDAGSLSCEPRSFQTPGGFVGDGDARVLELNIDANDRGVAAWPSVGDDGVTRIVVAEEQAPGQWKLREPGLALEGNGDMADISAGPDGSAAVAWRQTVAEGGRVFLSERDPQGVWRDPASMDDRMSFLPHAYEPRFAVRSSGETLLVWNQWISENFGVALARRASFGAPWEKPKSPEDVLSAKVFYSNAPRIAMNETGDALVTWYQSSGGPLMVRASERFGAEGSFSHPGPDDVISAGNFMGGGAVDSHPIANPMPAVAPNGEAAIAWTQEDGRGAIAVYLALRDASGVWAKPTDLDDTFSRPVGIARCARPVFGPGGELYVVWYQNEGIGDRVWAARRDASGKWVDGGQSPQLLSTEHLPAMTPSIAVGKDGAVLVVWVEKDGEQWRVAARRTGPSEPWGPHIVLSSESAGSAVYVAAAVSKKSGRALAGWTQGNTSDNKKVFIAHAE